MHSRSCPLTHLDGVGALHLAARLGELSTYSERGLRELVRPIRDSMKPNGTLYLGAGAFESGREATFQKRRREGVLFSLG